MAVAEYMMHRIEGGTRRAVPEFIGDRGHWQSPIDKSYIGWIDDARDYYVPDTVTTLTKAEFVTRLLTIHNTCLLYTSPSPRDIGPSRMPSSA